MYFCVLYLSFIIIARQCAIHAERDIVLPILSVCLSVRTSEDGIVSKRMDISPYFLIPMGTPQQGVKYRPRGNFANILPIFSKTVRERPIVTMQH